MNPRTTIMTGVFLAACAAAIADTEGGKACACCRSEAPSPYSKESIYQLGARFTDDTGRSFELGSLKGRPVVLDLFYTTCGNACPITVTDMLAIQNRLPVQLRGWATFVLVSFDPIRDTQEALARYRGERHLDGQWILLRGDDRSVRELASLLGVYYRQEADGTVSHSNVLTVLDRKGEVAYQRTGLNGGINGVCAAIQTAGESR
jgi:protein SCO1/2